MWVEIEVALSNLNIGGERIAFILPYAVEKETYKNGFQRPLEMGIRMITRMPQRFR